MGGGVWSVKGIKLVIFMGGGRWGAICQRCKASHFYGWWWWGVQSVKGVKLVIFRGGGGGQSVKGVKLVKVHKKIIDLDGNNILR